MKVSVIVIFSQPPHTIWINYIQKSCLFLNLVFFSFKWSVDHNGGFEAFICVKNLIISVEWKHTIEHSMDIIIFVMMASISKDWHYSIYLLYCCGNSRYLSLTNVVRVTCQFDYLLVQNIVMYWIYDLSPHFSQLVRPIIVLK